MVACDGTGEPKDRVKTVQFRRYHLAGIITATHSESKSIFSDMDVKSLFKSGKKTIKAFKVSSGPTSEVKDDQKPSDTPLEAWESPAITEPVKGNNLNVGVEDYKAESEQSTLKPVASWSQEKEQQEVVIEERSSTSAYVPPSQRRMDSAKAMPSVAEAATRLSATSSKAVPASTGPTPTRLKLITAASKKAIEEEERKKLEDRKRKEAEKQARREELKVEMERQVSLSLSEGVSSETIKAAPLEKIYAKYINRVKTGRKLVEVV